MGRIEKDGDDFWIHRAPPAEDYLIDADDVAEMARMAGWSPPESSSDEPPPDVVEAIAELGVAARATRETIRECTQTLKANAVEPDGLGVLIDAFVEARRVRTEAAIAARDVAMETAVPVPEPLSPVHPLVVGGTAAFLRALADAVDACAVDESDVNQALFGGDSYTIGCPISEAQNEARREHSEMVDQLADLARRIAP